MYSYGNASTHVGGIEGVPVPKVAAAPTGFVGWTVCHCGLKHRPGAWHLCIDLGTPEPKPAPVKPKKKAATKRPTKKVAPGRGKGSGFGGGPGNHGGKVVSRIEEVIRRYEGGESTTEIAKDIGVGRKAIVYALKTRGVPIRPAADGQRGKARPGLRVLSDEQVAQLVERYQAGESATQLRKAFGVALSTTITTLRREGVAIRDAGSACAFTPAEDAEIGKLYAAGASLADLAAKYGTGTGPVVRAVKRAGVTVRRRGVRGQSGAAA